MSPEGQRAQVLPDPDLGPKIVTHPYLIRGALQLLFNKVFCQNAWLRLQRHPVPPLHTLYLGVGGTGLIPPRTFPPSRTTYLPNFIKIHPAVWISVKNIHIHCPACPPPLWGSNKKYASLKIYFWEILLILHNSQEKITPSRSPLNTRNSLSRP